MSEKTSPQNDIAQLIQLGREQGYLTYADITDTLPDGSTDEDNFEEIIQVLRDMGIKVFENTPDEDELMLGEDEDTDDIEDDEELTEYEFDTDEDFEEIQDINQEGKIEAAMADYEEEE